MDKSSEALRLLRERTGSIILGKDRAVRLAIVTLLARGHLLMEDVPGVGKTTLAYTLARALDCSFHRIQFTSDLLPTDIIGVNVFNSQENRFEFVEGPLFANIVLADEINRTNPKTQSALLEAMNERRVTVERSTIVLPEPFMVIATQNPLEYHGTFPLPESQLDRFMLHMRLGYPDEEFEKQAVRNQRGITDIENMEPVIHASDVLEMQKEVESVHVEESLLDYLIAIVRATRAHDRIKLGASTRAAQYLLKVARANAYYEGRDYLTPDDVKEVAPAVLGHRLILKHRATLEDADLLIREILETMSVPV